MVQYQQQVAQQMTEYKQQLATMPPPAPRCSGSPFNNSPFRRRRSRTTAIDSGVHAACVVGLV